MIRNLFFEAREFCFLAPTKFTKFIEDVKNDQNQNSYASKKMYQIETFSIKIFFYHIKISTDCETKHDQPSDTLAQQHQLLPLVARERSDP